MTTEAATDKRTIAAADEQSKSDKHKRRKHNPKNLTVAKYSARKPVWSYLHLQHVSQPPIKTALDEMTVIMWIDEALQRFLGLHGRAIPVDIMKLDERDVWVRVPHDDHSALVAALSGWTSRDGGALRVLGSSSWDANCHGRDGGQDLFTD